jgi:hypothetical protein
MTMALPIDSLPGDSYVDPTQDEIALVMQDSGEMPDDAARATVQPAVDAFAKALAQGRRMQWWGADAVYSAMGTARSSGLLGRMQADAVARVPTIGAALSVESVEISRGAERQRVVESFQTSAGADFHAKKADKLAKVAAEAVEKGSALAEAVDRANADYDMPSALQGDVEIEDLHRQSNLEQEILARHDDAMAYAARQLESAIKYGRDDILKNLVPAVLRVANEVRLAPSGKFSKPSASHYKRLVGDVGVVDASVQAERLIKLVSDFRESRRPASIKIANNCLARMRPIFATIFGVPMSVDDFLRESSIQRNDRTTSQKMFGKVDPAWPLRFAPPSPVALPGWSPVVGKTSGGVPVRQPAPERAGASR